MLFKSDIVYDCNVGGVCICSQFSGLTPSAAAGSEASILPKGPLLGLTRHGAVELLMLPVALQTYVPVGTVRRSARFLIPPQWL